MNSHTPTGPTDCMTASGKLVSCLWMLIPGGIALTKLSEALNRVPMRTPEGVVDLDARATWDHTFQLKAVPNDNQAVIILNEGPLFRRVTLTLEILYYIALFTFVHDHSFASTAILFVVMTFRELFNVVLCSDEQRYWRRCQQWELEAKRQVPFIGVRPLLFLTAPLNRCVPRSSNCRIKQSATERH